MMRETSCCFAGHLPLSLKVGGRRAGDNSPGGNGCGIPVLTLVSCCRSPSSGMPRGATSRKSITQLRFLRMSWTSITPPLRRDGLRAWPWFSRNSLCPGAGGRWGQGRPSVAGGAVAGHQPQQGPGVAGGAGNAAVLP